MGPNMTNAMKGKDPGTEREKSENDWFLCTMKTENNRLLPKGKRMIAGQGMKRNGGVGGVGGRRRIELR